VSDGLQMHPAPSLSFSTLINHRLAVALGLCLQIIVSVFPLLVDG